MLGLSIGWRVFVEGPKGFDAMRYHEALAWLVKIGMLK